jgi:hypothetical protein
MEVFDPDKLAWCATFAGIFAFETKRDFGAAMKVAVEAYRDNGNIAPETAVQFVLQAPLTWPGTERLERAQNHATSEHH